MRTAKKRSASMLRVYKLVRRTLKPDVYVEFIKRIPQEVLIEIMQANKPEHKFGEYVLGNYSEEYKKDNVDRNKIIRVALTERMKELGLDDYIQSGTVASIRNPRKNSLPYKMKEMLRMIDETKKAPDVENITRNLNYLEEILTEKKRRLEKLKRT